MSVFQFLMNYTKEFISNKIKILLITVCSSLLRYNDFSNIIAPFFSTHIAKDFTSFIIICLVNYWAKFTPFSKNWIIRGKNEKKYKYYTLIIVKFILMIWWDYVLLSN